MGTAGTRQLIFKTFMNDRTTFRTKKIIVFPDLFLILNFILLVFRIRISVRIVPKEIILDVRIIGIVGKLQLAADFFPGNTNPAAVIAYRTFKDPPFVFADFDIPASVQYQFFVCPQGDVSPFKRLGKHMVSGLNEGYFILGRLCGNVDDIYNILFRHFICFPKPFRDLRYRHRTDYYVPEIPVNRRAYTKVIQEFRSRLPLRNLHPVVCCNKIQGFLGVSEIRKHFYRYIHSLLFIRWLYRLGTDNIIRTKIRITKGLGKLDNIRVCFFAS